MYGGQPFGNFQVNRLATAIGLSRAAGIKVLAGSTHAADLDSLVARDVVGTRPRTPAPNTPHQPRVHPSASPPPAAKSRVCGVRYIEVPAHRGVLVVCPRGVEPVAALAEPIPAARGPGDEAEIRAIRNGGEAYVWETLSLSLLCRLIGGGGNRRGRTASPEQPGPHVQAARRGSTGSQVVIGSMRAHRTCRTAGAGRRRRIS